MRFEIEWSGLVGARPVVMARALLPGDFDVTEDAALGGCRLLPFVDMPRLLGPDGRLRLDVFAFELADAADLARLCAGQAVSLTGGPAQDRGPAP